MWTTDKPTLPRHVSNLVMTTADPEDGEQQWFFAITEFSRATMTVNGKEVTFLEANVEVDVDKEQLQIRIKV